MILKELPGIWCQVLLSRTNWKPEPSSLKPLADDLVNLLTNVGLRPPLYGSNKEIKEKMELPTTVNPNNNVISLFFLPVSAELLPARLES